MGKIKVRKTLLLQYETESLKGLEVRAEVVSLGRILDLADLADRARAGAGLKEVRDLVDEFTAALRSWNYQREDGSAIPATTEEFLDLDTDDAMEILLSWVDGMTSVSDRLGKALTSGGTFPEASIPMEMLS